MITDRIDPPELLRISEIVNVSIATGSRVIHISGQTSVDVEGKVVGSTHLEQSRLAFRNVRTALEAAGATLDDVAKFNIYVVDYSWDALEALMAAAPSDREDHGATHRSTNRTEAIRVTIGS